jgi:hypothetical protein
MVGSHAINQLGSASDDVNNSSLQDRSQTDLLRRTGDFSILFSHGPNLGNDRSTAVDSQAYPTQKLAGVLNEKSAASRSHKETTSGSVGLRVVAQPTPQPSQNAIKLYPFNLPSLFLGNITTFSRCDSNSHICTLLAKVYKGDISTLCPPAIPQ